MPVRGLIARLAADKARRLAQKAPLDGPEPTKHRKRQEVPDADLTLYERPQDKTEEQE